MHMHDRRLADGGRHGRWGAQPPTLLGRVVTLAVGTVLAAAACAASLALIALALAAGMLAWGYVWWKTRTLRGRLRAASAAPARDPFAGGAWSEGGRVIEGEAVRSDDRGAAK